MNRRSIWSFAAVAAVLVASIACRQHAEEEPAPVVTVDVAPVLLSTIQQIVRGDALIYPKQQSALVPKIASPVHVLHVKRGDKVRTGQALVDLESRDLAGAAAESR